MTQPHEPLTLQEPQDILSLLESAARDKPFFPLYTFLDRRLQPAHVVSCQELMTESVRLAGAIQSRFSRGEPLILFYPHTPAFIFALFACVLAGCVPLPLSFNKRRDIEKLNSLIASSGIRSVISTSDVIDNMSAYKTDLQSDDGEISLRIMATDRCDIAASWSRPNVNVWDTALIQLSASAGGVCKGTAISHRAMLMNLSRMSDAMKLNAEDRILSVTACQEGHGLMMHILLPLYAQISGFFLDADGFLARPSSWLDALSRYRCTISGSLGFAYASATGHGETYPPELDLSGWRVAYVGQDVVDVRTLRRFARKFRDHGFSSRAYFHFYGMAETGYFVCGRFGLHVEIRNAISYISAGKIPVNHDWHFSSDCGEERLSDEGVLSLSSVSIGAICIPRPESNSRTFVEYLEALAAANRAGIRRTLITGDLVFSRDGEIYITAQVSNKICHDGKVFCLEDIEALAMSSVGCRRVIRCVAVFLEERKELMLAVECSHGDMAESWRGVVSRIKESINNSIGVGLSRILLLRPNSLPVNGSGKVLRTECKALLRGDALMTRLLPVRGRGLTSV